jgi:predicted dehydrogenase
MALAALENGAHLLTEKPFTLTLADADEILAVGRRTNRKISVAHQMRLAPEIVHLQQAIERGLIGRLVQMRSWGKQDHRAGGEDMLVLGTHLFDMMRLFAGDPLSCHGHVFVQGREITTDDRRQGTEQIGPVAGDEIEAEFAFNNAVTARFTSRALLRETLGHWALELIGSQGTARILMDIAPAVFQRHRLERPSPGWAEDWQVVSHILTERSTPDQRGFGPANRRVVRDWLEAIAQDRAPACSGQNGMKACEMVMAVYDSALQRQRVTLPLLRRSHPLAG